MLPLTIAALLLAAVAGFKALAYRQALLVAYRDTAYGILTRAGGEEAWRRIRRSGLPVDLIFVDLDKIHEANETYGYADVDRRIAKGLAVVRRQDVKVAMRWYSGDEIVIVVPLGAGEAVANRVQQELRKQGLSGTFGVASVCPTAPLNTVVEEAMGIVQVAKLQNQRGQVVLAS